MDFTRELNLNVFFSVDLDLMKRVYPKTRLRKTLSVERDIQVTKVERHRGNNWGKKHAQILLNFCKRDFEAVEPAPKSPQ